MALLGNAWSLRMPLKDYWPIKISLLKPQQFAHTNQLG